jgi:hypothetical protein
MSFQRALSARSQRGSAGTSSRVRDCLNCSDTSVSATLRRAGRWLAAIVIVALPLCPPSIGAVPEYDLKAALLYKFTKFIAWPDRTFSNPGGTLHLCLVGRDDFGASIQSLQGQKVQSQTIQIERLPDPGHAPAHTLDHCQIAFISGSERERLPGIISSLANTAVLTVSDMDGFAAAGGMIGFVSADNKIGFEINQRASRHAGIEIGAQLLQFATPIAESRTETAP